MALDRRDFLKRCGRGALLTAATAISGGVGLGAIETALLENDHQNPSLRNLTHYIDSQLVDQTVGGNQYQFNQESIPERIVTLAFGNSTYEGSSNYQLAAAVHDALDHYGKQLPVFAQREVGEVLDQYGIEHKPLIKVGSMWRDYADTEEMFRRLKALASGASGENTLVAHPAQMERAMYLAASAGMDSSPFLKPGMGWNEKDGQSWVTSPTLWAPREIGIRLYDMARL